MTPDQRRLIDISRSIADLKYREHEAAAVLADRRKARQAAEREALALLAQLGAGQPSLPIFAAEPATDVNGANIDTDLERVLAAESDADAADEPAPAAAIDPEPDGSDGPPPEDCCEVCGEVWTDCQCPDDVKNLATMVETALGPDVAHEPVSASEPSEDYDPGSDDQVGVVEETPAGEPDWRSVPVSKMGLPKSLMETLPRLKIVTAGQAWDFIRDREKSGTYGFFGVDLNSYGRFRDRLEALAKTESLKDGPKPKARPKPAKSSKASKKSKPKPPTGPLVLGEDGLFVVRINGGKPDHAVRAAGLLSARLYAKTLGGKVETKPDNGEAGRLGLRIVEYIATNQVGCNKCHAIRPAGAPACPKCGCPEYHRSPIDVAAEREAEAAAKARKGKAVAS